MCTCLVGVLPHDGNEDFFLVLLQRSSVSRRGQRPRVLFLVSFRIASVLHRYERKHLQASLLVVFPLFALECCPVSRLTSVCLYFEAYTCSAVLFSFLWSFHFARGVGFLCLWSGVSFCESMQVSAIQEDTCMLKYLWGPSVCARVYEEVLLDCLLLFWALRFFCPLLHFLLRLLSGHE